MNLAPTLQTLLPGKLPAKRWQRRLLEATLIVAVVLAAQYWQTHGLPEGVAPPLAVVLTDGHAIKVGPSTGSGQAAGNTATSVAFRATWRPLCPAETFPA